MRHCIIRAHLAWLEVKRIEVCLDEYILIWIGLEKGIIFSP